MRITISSTPPRNKPREGDRKTVKGVEYVRVRARVPEGMPHAGALLSNCGHPVYRWVEAEKLDRSTTEESSAGRTDTHGTPLPQQPEI